MGRVHDLSPSIGLHREPCAHVASAVQPPSRSWFSIDRVKGVRLASGKQLRCGLTPASRELNRKLSE